MKILVRILLFLFLTILTQVGGLVYIFTLLIDRFWNKRFLGKSIAIFIPLYLILTFLIVPFIAPFFGREKIKNSINLKPVNYFTTILNRNYVRPELNVLLLGASQDLQKNHSPIIVRYLDANFPFFNGFPLLPHLSHHDGKKLDLSLVYENKEGQIVDLQKSRSGYGVFSEPEKGEFNQTERCKNEGYSFYDYPKYLSLGQINSSVFFSQSGTKQLIESILKQTQMGKLFIEPHLKDRMELSDPKIRFHGCKAVRHDDHIHIQLK